MTDCGCGYTNQLEIVRLFFLVSLAVPVDSRHALSPALSLSVDFDATKIYSV